MPKQDSPCMFCGGLPCVCGGGQKKKSSIKMRKASSPAKTSKTSPDSTPSVSDTEASTEDVFGAIPERATRKFKTESASERDLSYESALRILRPIVSPKDQRMIDKELARNYPQEVDRRVSEWKRNHG